MGVHGRAAVVVLGGARQPHPAAASTSATSSRRPSSRRPRDYERFLRIDFLLATVVLLVVLGIWAAKGERFTRESAAGRVGTGMLLGMLGFAIVWLAQLPFSVAALWWERRHGISKQGYFEVITGSFLGLGGQFLFICAGIGIVMGLAAWLKNRWWILGAPVFVALVAGYSFVQPYLLGRPQQAQEPDRAGEPGAGAQAGHRAGPGQGRRGARSSRPRRMRWRSASAPRGA